MLRAWTDCKHIDLLQRKQCGGGSLVTGGTILVGSSVTSAGADSFSIPQGGLFSASASVLASLNRGVNFHLGQGATVLNLDGGAAGSANMGQAADLFAAWTGSYTGNISLGAGTPWEGLNGMGTGSYSGTLTASSPIVLKKFRNLGNGSVGSFAIDPGTGAGAQGVTIDTSTLWCPAPDFSGVENFVFTGRAGLAAANALGGAGGSGIPSSLVATGATLTISATNAINGSVHLATGAQLDIAAPGLNGTGTISRDDGPVIFNLDNSGRFYGPAASTVIHPAGRHGRAVRKRRCVGQPIRSGDALCGGPFGFGSRRLLPQRRSLFFRRGRHTWSEYGQERQQHDPRRRCRRDVCRWQYRHSDCGNRADSHRLELVGFLPGPYQHG